MARFCTHCGHEVEGEAIVCVKCGCTLSQKKNNVDLDSSSKIQISLILGIIGIVSAWLFALVGHITSIVGIVIGVKEYKETEKNLGLVLSIIGEVCSVVSSIIGVFYYL